MTFVSLFADHFGQWMVKEILINKSPIKKYSDLHKHGVQIQEIAELPADSAEHCFPFDSLPNKCK